MATATSPLTEPRVLARAKQRLFPDSDSAADEEAYAVVDTQFATDEWLPGRPLDADLRETLAPFNHVRVGSGYPDLVGVRTLDSDLLAVDRVGDRPPLVAVEAKGYTEDGTANVERGIVQAYDRLAEANVAYAAVPASSVTQPTRTLARELNVGVLGVTDGGTVEPLEVPRVVGNRTADEATAIRFQASARGVAEDSFPLNHPKNYLAYPVALYHPGDTGALLAEHVVGATDEARHGAANLDLVDADPDGVRLASLGREVVRFARWKHGSTGDALAAFEDWQHSRKRFVDLAPAWGQLARRILFAYPATTLLVEELQRLHDDGLAEPTLVDLVERLHRFHPSFAVELFVRGTDRARTRVLEPDGDLRTPALEDGSVYHAPTVFQLKAMLFHAGILTERGAEPHRLDPTADAWALRESLTRAF